MALVRRIAKESTFRRLKSFLMIFNTISFIVALAILDLNFYFRFDWDTKHYIQILDAQFLWNGSYVLMVASGLVIIFSIVGCWATVYEHPGLFRLNAWVLMGIFLLEISGLSYCLDWGTFKSKITPWMTDKMLSLIDHANFDPKIARVVNVIQEKIGCCGANDWLDYEVRNMPMPYQCRDPDNGNQWDLGCEEQFSYWVETRVAWMSGIALALAVFQVFGIVANLLLRHLVLKCPAEGAEYNIPSKMSEI